MRKSLFGIYHPAHKATLLILDVFAISLAFFISSKLRLGLIPDFYSSEFISLCFIIIATLFVGNAYTSVAIGSQPRLPLNTFFIILSSSIPATIFIYWLGPERFTYLFGRGIFPVAIFLVGGFAMCNRLLLNYVFRSDKNKRRVLIIGDLQSREQFQPEDHLAVAAMHLDYSENLTDIRHLADFQAVVIAPSYRPNKENQQALIDARLVGIPIFSLSDFFESFLFLVPVNEIDNDWFIRTEGFTMLHSTVSTRVKRAIDIVAALILLILTLPICITATIWIKLVSRGPALFSQTRVGLKGTTFTLYKFRTMKLGAEPDGAQWAKANDNRVILFGNFLRTTRIDELPQCWNILKGEMSIIGPRPERPEFTEQLAKEIPYYELRHIVKPGLSGWAQVSYPYGASVEDALRKLQYDLYYIKNYSLILDLNILLRTILVTLGRKGR